jgi:dipeptide/tripeptide permease
LEIDLYPNLYWGVNVAAILFILPVVNFLVIPSFPKLTIRARIGIGLVLYCIAGLCVVVIHAVPLAQHATHQTSEVSGIQLAFLLVPVLIIALAEVLTIVSVLEFIYAQSPESMKGLLSGLFYFFLGLTSIPSSALYYIYRESRENRILVRFHAGFTAIMVVGTVVYVVAATLHRNRQRHDDDSLQQRLIIENQLHSTINA